MSMFKSLVIFLLTCLFRTGKKVGLNISKLVLTMAVVKFVAYSLLQGLFYAW